MSQSHAGAIVAIFAGKQTKRFFVLSFTNPVYMLQQQRVHKVDGKYQFFLCVSKTEFLAREEDNDVLFDTRELTAHEYLNIRKRYTLQNVTKCATANDQTTVAYAMGWRPWQKISSSVGATPFIECKNSEPQNLLKPADE
jgi:hypothetical protein